MEFDVKNIENMREFSNFGGNKGISEYMRCMNV